MKKTNDIANSNQTNKYDDHLELKKIVGNSLWLIFERGALLSISLIVTILIARHLGPEQYGIFNYCLSVIGFFSGIAALGWDRIIARDLTYRKQQAFEIINTHFSFKLFGSLISLVAAFILTVINQNDTNSNQIVVILSLSVILTSASVVDLYFSSLLQSAILAPLKIGIALLGASLKIALIFNNGNIVQLAIISVVENFILASGCVIIFKNKTKHNIRPVFSRKYSYKLVKEGWPLFMGLQLDIMSQKIYGILLSRYMSDFEYGQFMLAFRLIEIPLIIVYLVSTSFLPKLIYLRENNPKDYERMIVLSCEIGTIVGVVSWMIIAFAGAPTISMMFGPEYDTTGTAFILMWGAVLIQANAIFRAHYLTIEKSTNTLMLGNFIGLLMSVPLAVFFIKNFGVEFAGIAFTFTNLILYYLSGLITVKGRQIMRLQTYALSFPNIKKKLF